MEAMSRYPSNISQVGAPPEAGTRCLPEVLTAPPPRPILLPVSLGTAPDGGDDAFCPGLTLLGGDHDAEYWTVDAPVSTGTLDGLPWRRAGDWLAMAISLVDSPEKDPADLVEQAYRRLVSALHTLDGRQFIRLWNFIPAINAGFGDDERYRRFCVGRGRALDAAGLDDGKLCAATAIGGDGSDLRIVALAGKTSAHHIENPRQISAHRYPRQYGPRSPAFARATALGGDQDDALLLISGTASVVGHATAHPHELAGQLDEMTRNVDVLVAEAAEQLPGKSWSGLGPGTVMRAYVRDARDWPAVRDHLLARWPGLRLAGLRGDICRRDLLVEVEAVHRPV